MAKQRSSSAFLDNLLGTAKRASPAAATELVDPPPTAASRALDPEPAPAAEVAPLPAIREIDMDAEALVTRLMALRSVPSEGEAAETLATLNGLLHDLNRKTVIVVFLLGKVLTMVKASMQYGEFVPWIQQSCPFTRMSAFNYMRVYERYKGSPKKALAELTLTEAYIEAGVKKIGAPEQEEKARRYGDDVDEPADPVEDWERLFKGKTLSGKPLKYYRTIALEDGCISVVRKGYGAIPVCDIHVNMAHKSPAYQLAVTEIHQNIRMAVEVFYEKIEAMEDSGEIPSLPVQTRKDLLAAMEKPKNEPLPSQVKANRNVLALNKGEATV